ncbi:Hemerythrin domain-containing protein [Mycena indigotica]|uniref:Hemerythrin domain-containing protein n=1 Tax=Mycena indigotica TaxID=2126181 RepID=A0A8H6WF39_9AGAR|nr:Hemerythrin domain-containing protein [Mycena indigotica]KAF7316364.1 Hemerythrin domain-containing protein [Mycena indigotica]
MPSIRVFASAGVLALAIGAVYLFPTRKVSPTAMSDPYVALQYNMANTHDLYKSAYKTILPHLDNPPLDDLDNFLGYTRAWASSIVGHHDSEEAVLFPFLSKKVDFSKEIEQHVTVEKGLSEILKYIDRARAEPSTFEAAKLKNLVETLGGPLFEHLDQEVEDLAPEKLKVFTAEELTQAGKDLMVYVRAHSDKYVTLPFMRCHTPPELKETWPPFPWIVKRLVVPWILAPKNSGYWKYAPYDMS